MSLTIPQFDADAVAHTRREAVRATRALSLVHMGELSAARQALEGASLAPGNLATLVMLTDPTRRLPSGEEGSQF